MLVPPKDNEVSKGVSQDAVDTCYLTSALASHPIHFPTAQRPQGMEPQPLQRGGGGLQHTGLCGPCALRGWRCPPTHGAGRLQLLLLSRQHSACKPVP